MLDIGEDFDDVEMCESVAMSGGANTTAYEDDFEESAASDLSAPPLRAHKRRAHKSSSSFGSSRSMRVGTPGVAVSSGLRSPKPLPLELNRNGHAGMDDLTIEEERDDVDQVLEFRKAASSSGAKASSYTVHTFRDIRDSGRRQFDDSCVLLGTATDGGGVVMAVHRFPLAGDELTSLNQSGITSGGQLAPSVVRALRSRFQQLAKVPPSPYILRSHGATLSNGALFCASDYAAGGALAEFATSGGGTGAFTPPEEVSRLVLLHVVRGLRHLHVNGVSHGAVHVRNIFVDVASHRNSAAGPSSGAGAADEVDEDIGDVDDPNAPTRIAAHGLVFTLGGFHEAVVGGKAVTTAASPWSKESPSAETAATRGAGAWAEKVAEVDDVDDPLVPQSAGFSPIRRSKAHVNGAAAAQQQPLGRSGGDDPMIPPVDLGGTIALSGSAAGADADLVGAFAEDLRSVSALFATLFHGFDAGGEMACADVSMSLDVSEEHPRSPTSLLSRDARQFEIALHDAVAASSMAVNTAARRGSPLSRRAAIASTVERLDALLAEDFVDDASVRKAVATLCRKAAAKGRVFKSAQAAPPPLPVRMYTTASENRKAVAVECVKHRGGPAGGSTTFRFAAARPTTLNVAQDRSRQPRSPGRVTVRDPDVDFDGTMSKQANAGRQAQQQSSGPATARVVSGKATVPSGPSTARRTMAML